MVKSVRAQSIPVPPVPSFTVRYVPSFYNATNPYTGANQQIDNSSIVVSIQNEPLYYAGKQLTLFYNVRTKGHFEADDWSPLYPILNLTIYNGPVYSLADTGIASSNSEYTTVSYPAINYPSNSQVDFSVQELAWNSSQVLVYPNYLPDGVGVGPPCYETVYYLIGTSDWSPSQTVAISANSTSASTTSTPIVPELSWVAIVPLLLSILPVAVIFRNRKNR